MRGPALGVVFLLAAGCARPSATDRAQALVGQHREPEAIALLRERVRVEPGDLVARRLLVRVLAADGQWVEARAEVGELSRRMPPGDPVPYLELGHALELVHRYDEALAAYDEAAAVAPKSPAGPREGGLRCARWGEGEEARTRLEEAVRRGAGDAELWHALGLVRLHLGDLDGAETAYRAGVAADPKGAESWLGLATLAMVRGDAQGALEAYEQILARRPRFAAGELGRAWALGRLGRREEAARALEHATELGAPAGNVARQRDSWSAATDAGDR